jgi:hypothetical protein
MAERTYPNNVDWIASRLPRQQCQSGSVPAGRSHQSKRVRSRQCQSKRAGLLAFSAALGTALVTAPFLFGAPKQPPPRTSGLQKCSCSVLMPSPRWARPMSDIDVIRAEIERMRCQARRDKATSAGRDTEQFCRGSTRKDAQQD